MDFRIEQLRQLPQRPDEVWQGALVRMPSWVQDDQGEPYRPWAAFWAAVKDEKVFPAGMCRPGEDGPHMLWDGLVQFATDDEIGGYRPGRVEIRGSAAVEHLKPLLDSAGIELVEKEDLPAISMVLDVLAREFEAHLKLPGCFTGEGVTLPLMRDFAEAVAAFYQTALWQYLQDVDLVAIESPQAPRGMRCFTIMGGGDLPYGIGFYDSPEACWEMRGPQHMADGPDELWSLTLTPITQIALEDADLWQEEQLPLAGAAAYPYLGCYQRGGKMIRPDATRLQFVIRVFSL